MKGGINMSNPTRPERIVSSETIEVEAGELVIPNSGVPTQVASPRQATKRTVAAVVVALAVVLPIINVALDIVADELAQANLAIPAWLWAGLNGAIALVAVLSGIVTRVLAIPGVNDWITDRLPFLSANPVDKSKL